MTRVVNAQLTDEERSLEQALRPQTLNEYIGQARMKIRYASASRRQSSDVSRWTMRFSMVRRAWERRPSLTSLRVKWVGPFAPPRGSS